VKFKLDENLSPSLASLLTFDLDFSNIHAYPPKRYAGIAVLRLGSQAHPVARAAVERILALLPHERLSGTLWIVEEDRVRIRE
jgi:hypothetical protein